MNRLLLLGLNHTSAPLAVREKLAFNTQQARAATDQFRERFPEAELVLLSTCNRVEFYTSRPVHSHPRVEELIEFIGQFHTAGAEQFEPHLYTKTDKDVVDHLFNVVSSLDSMVLGETQILGQVRDAYDAACAAQSTGAMLNPLFQRALAVGKQVMRDTALCEGRVSVASVAVDYARRIFDHFQDKTVLSIGAGKMATLALTGFAALSPGKLLICNRDADKAGRLAERFNAEPVPFDNLSDHLVAADIVISSTGSAKPIITRDAFARIVARRRYRPMFLIDIALPRDIESGVGDIENVYLYNLDDLQQVVATTQNERAGATTAAKEIVAQQLQEFVLWHRQRAMGPMIDRLYKRYQDIAAQEVARTVKKLGPLDEQEKSHLEELARRLVNKLLHDPIQTLRQSDAMHGPAAQYLHAMEQLFKLNAPDGEDEDDLGQDPTA